MERRLTTIFVADVAGYSRMMEADEQGTYAALQTVLNEIIDPEIANHRGALVKRMGDGVLARFESVVDAVNAAIEIQKRIAAAGSDTSADQRLQFRIGIHLGDVIVENGDIHGDGVNIAARLESLAAPGAICISRQVKEHVETQNALDWKDLGQCRLKNISRPIHAFQADPLGAIAPLNPPRPRARKRLVPLALLAALVVGTVIWFQPWKPSATAPAQPPAVSRQTEALPALAVLPFQNLSGSPEQDYLALGISEDLITDLAQVSGLVVIARNSTFAYRGLTPDLHEVAQSLQARYILQGSMRQSGNQIRINTQLVDTQSGTNIWAERYDRSVNDIFALQDDVRQRIVEALKVQLSPDEARKLSQAQTDSPEAYDAFLRAREQESNFTASSTREAIRLYRLALEHDPDFVAATARLSIAYTLAADNGWVADTDEGLELARNLAVQAVTRDPNLPLAHWAIARYYTRDETWDTDRAISALETAIAIDPNYADGHAMLANTLQFVGRAEEGLSHIEIAMRLNPNFPFWYYFALGTNQFQLTHYRAAKESFEKAISGNPNWSPSYRYLISTLGHLGLTEDAEWQMEELRALGVEVAFDAWESRNKIQDSRYREQFLEGLRLAGLPET